MKEFKYMVDEFADIKIIRYTSENFNQLTLKQKKYVYYLTQATLWGRDIFWIMNGQKNLELRKLIEHILKTYNGNKKLDIYLEFMIYAKTIFAYNGNHHHYNLYKVFPAISKEEFKKILNQCDKYDYNVILEYIYEAEIKCDDLIKNSHMNYYENVTETEAKMFYQDKENNDNKLSHGLNSKLIKINSVLEEQIYKIDGLYNDYLEKIIEYLTLALPYAENKKQQEYTKLLIKYFKTGNLSLWNEYNISWVKELNSQVDYINGFIEVYLDPIGHKGSYESFVNIVNVEKTNKIKKITDNAQWFEDHSPFEDRFKKECVQGLSANVIDAIIMSGDMYPSAPIGINLPNSSWIRKEYGSKSVTIINLTEALNKAMLESKKSLQKEFTHSDEEYLLQKKYGLIAENIHTTLHETLGHGSGKLLPNVSENALKEYYSTIEEARAELFGLYYIYNQKMIDLEIIEDFNPAITKYNAFIKNGLIIQLVQIKLGNDVLQAHMQARKIIASWCYENGKKDNVISMFKENNKTYVKINDYDKLRKLFGDLINIIQTIKSTGDYEAAKDLVETYGKKVDQKLHNEILERYKTLDVKPYTGFLNPNIIPIFNENEIIDIKLDHSQDFIEQQLYYGEYYSI